MMIESGDRWLEWLTVMGYGAFALLVTWQVFTRTK